MAQQTKGARSAGIDAYIERANPVFQPMMESLRDAPDQTVQCSIRPEEFVIGANEGEGVRGTVKEFTYLGLNTHYFVDTEDGQTVEIVTAPSASPSPQWLDWVVSGRARTAIRQHLKRLQHEDAIDFGHLMLDRAMDTRDVSFESIANEVLEGARRHGVLVGKGGLYGNVIRIAPPLTITAAEADRAVDALEAVFEEIATAG